MINISPKTLNYFLQSLPNFLWPLKWYIKNKSLKYCGNNFRFGVNSTFIDHRLITIGENVFFGKDAFISTNTSVEIGDNVMFGPDVMIIGGDHRFGQIGVPMNKISTGGYNKSIKIENDVWIGARTIVLKGVTIFEGAVIGAGSVVTNSLPPYTICYGNPCTPQKLRFTKSDLKKHLHKVQSKYSIEQIDIEIDEK